MISYREVGVRLSEYIRNEHPTTQKIQGFLSDLLADDELLEVMQNVVGRPSFQALEMLASSGEGSAQRDALIHELTRRYLPVIVDDIGELLNGLLDLPAGKTNRPQSSAFNPSDSQVLPKPCAENINTIVDLSQVSERLLSMLDETEAPKPETRETTIYAENPNKPSRQIKRLGVITGTIAALVTSPYLIWIHLGLIPTPTYLPISQKLLQESYNDRILLYCLLGSHEYQSNCGDVRRSRREYRQAIANYDLAIKQIESRPPDFDGKDPILYLVDTSHAMKSYVGMGYSLGIIGFGSRKCYYYSKARDLYTNFSNTIYQSGHKDPGSLIGQLDEIYVKIKDSFNPQYSPYLGTWAAGCSG